MKSMTKSHRSVISNPGIPGEKSATLQKDFSSDTHRNDSCPKVPMTAAGYVITHYAHFFWVGPRNDNFHPFMSDITLIFTCPYNKVTICLINYFCSIRQLLCHEDKKRRLVPFYPKITPFTDKIATKRQKKSPAKTELSYKTINFTFSCFPCAFHNGS